MTVDRQIISLLNNSTMSVRQLSENIDDVNRSTITVHIKNLRKWGDVIPIRCNERRVGCKGFVYTSRTSINRRMLG